MTDIVASKAREIINLKIKKKWLEQELKTLNKDLSNKSKILFHIMFNEDIQSLNIDGKTVFRTVKPYPRIVNEQSFFKWAKDNGFGDLIKETIHPNTLRSWYTEYSEQNDNAETTLTDMLEIFEEEGIGVRKTK